MKSKCNKFLSQNIRLGMFTVNVSQKYLKLVSTFNNLVTKYAIY